MDLSNSTGRHPLFPLISFPSCVPILKKSKAKKVPTSHRMKWAPKAGRGWCPWMHKPKVSNGDIRYHRHRQVKRQFWWWMREGSKTEERLRAAVDINYKCRKRLILEEAEKREGWNKVRQTVNLYIQMVEIILSNSHKLVADTRAAYTNLLIRLITVSKDHVLIIFVSTVPRTTHGH